MTSSLPGSTIQRTNHLNVSLDSNHIHVEPQSYPQVTTTSTSPDHENKYGKRRFQRYQQRLKHSLILLGTAIFLFIFTMHHVSSERRTARRRKQQQQVFLEPQGQQRPERQRVIRNGAHPTYREAKPNDDRTTGPGLVGRLFRSFTGTDKTIQMLENALDAREDRMQANRNLGVRWVNMDLVPSLHTGQRKRLLETTMRDMKERPNWHKRFFHVNRKTGGLMAWEVENKAKQLTPPRYNYVDYTKHEYEYPEKLLEPPPNLGDYPKLQPLKEIMEIWPQDELDNPPNPIQEELMHFDYTKPEELEAARKFRDAKLPFKLINVPEVIAAGQKWTDDYLAKNFDGGYDTNGLLAEGTCQESVDNFFSFFVPPMWNVERMGIPATLNNDWTFAKWSQHARYADHIGLNANQPHFYYQAGVDKEERHKNKDLWTFISRDLPSFSSPTETFFVFEPQSQKGIQCRFGERGVTAATHYDKGRNMVAMMSGAKRYVLSPPRECSKLGIVNTRASPIYRHSMLNFGHLNLMDDHTMPPEEREWLKVAGTADAVSTVLKAGEVLYIPSNWFHYITSVQKSAQCNVRSGIDNVGDNVFGGDADVTDYCDAAHRH